MNIFDSLSSTQLYLLLFGVTFLATIAWMLRDGISHKKTASPFPNFPHTKGKKKLSEKDLGEIRIPTALDMPWRFLRILLVCIVLGMGYMLYTQYQSLSSTQDDITPSVPVDEPSVSTDSSQNQLEALKETRKHVDELRNFLTQ